MSMRYYPVYAQGAIFYKSDYDPVKVISAVASDCVGGLPPSIHAALKSDCYNRAAAEEICGLLSVPFDSTAENYSFISDSLMEDLEYSDMEGSWKIEDGTVQAIYFSNLEAEYRYAGDDSENEMLDSCLILTLPSPFIWDVAEYDGPKTKQEVIDCIKEAARVLLKDDIDWASRLGDLVGTTFG